MGKSCCFFGHRDTPESVREKLETEIIRLIEREGVDTFYMGNQGNFDIMAQNTVRALQMRYQHIKYSVMLAYMPKEGDREIQNSVYPDGLEKVPRRFAIDKRNRIMLAKSDCIIAYVIAPTGGAAKFYALAKRKNKMTVNIGEQMM